MSFALLYGFREHTAEIAQQWSNPRRHMCQKVLLTPTSCDTGIRKIKSWYGIIHANQSLSVPVISQAVISSRGLHGDKVRTAEVTLHLQLEVIIGIELQVVEKVFLVIAVAPFHFLHCVWASLNGSAYARFRGPGTADPGDAACRSLSDGRIQHRCPSAGSGGCNGSTR